MPKHSFKFWGPVNRFFIAIFMANGTVKVTTGWDNKEWTPEKICEFFNEHYKDDSSAESYMATATYNSMEEFIQDATWYYNNEPDVWGAVVYRGEGKWELFL